jgi:hypothetical protein
VIIFADDPDNHYLLDFASHWENFHSLGEFSLRCSFPV